MYRLFILLVLLPCIAPAETISERDRLEFTVRYAGFIEILQSGAWNALSTYESSDTKCGFGPGQHGPGCIRKAVAANRGCMEDMLLSLKQGCKISVHGAAVSCQSPPQWGNDSIIMPGARAGFIYQKDMRSIKITHFICGGD